jgi:hypothetical protein
LSVIRRWRFYTKRPRRLAQNQSAISFIAANQVQEIARRRISGHNTIVRDQVLSLPTLTIMYSVPSGMILFSPMTRSSLARHALAQDIISLYCLFIASLLQDLLVRRARKGVIIELGCGSGRNLLYLKKIGVQNELVGFELSPVSVDLANRAAKTFNLDVNFATADVTKNHSIQRKHRRRLFCTRVRDDAADFSRRAGSNCPAPPRSCDIFGTN